MDFTIVSRALRSAWALGSVVVLLGCRDSLPVAPDDLVEGVVVYQDINYTAASAHISQDIKDLKDFDGPCFKSSDEFGVAEYAWNDCISSVRIAPGWRAILYRDDDFKGERLEVSQDIPNLQLAGSGTCKGGRGFNDCITSMQLFRPGTLPLVTQQHRPPGWQLLSMFFALRQFALV